jgi:hypothetical protein
MKESLFRAIVERNNSFAQDRARLRPKSRWMLGKEKENYAAVGSAVAARRFWSRTLKER